MKRLLFLLVALIYCNATWQAVVWGREFFWAFVAFLLIFLIPIVSGVADSEGVRGRTPRQ